MPQRAKSGGTISAMRLGISKGEVGQPGKGHQRILMAGNWNWNSWQIMGFFHFFGTFVFSVLRFSSKSSEVSFFWISSKIVVGGGLRVDILAEPSSFSELFQKEYQSFHGWFFRYVRLQRENDNHCFTKGPLSTCIKSTVNQCFGRTQRVSSKGESST